MEPLNYQEHQVSWVSLINVDHLFNPYKSESSFEKIGRLSKLMTAQSITEPPKAL